MSLSLLVSHLSSLTDYHILRLLRDIYVVHSLREVCVQECLLALISDPCIDTTVQARSGAALVSVHNPSVNR